MIEPPVLMTFWPRTKPSVESIAIQRGGLPRQACS
ncbi:hypothetical protein HaLaN_10249, partial [Haematococcus lacustris]|uniref:Uncharacterized protein n=1 Tax=Haematococcus lacustris TaxID=44745 RepID=A0A699YV14_HAELA